MKQIGGGLRFGLFWILYLSDRAGSLSARPFRSVLRRSRGKDATESALQAHNRLFRVAARNVGLEAQPLGSKFLVISDGESRIFVSGASLSFESLTAYRLCGDKFLSSSMLEAAGLPVPAFRCVHGRSVTYGMEAYRSLPHPVVVKPRHGSSGKGVTVEVDTETELVCAYRRAIRYCPDVIVERFVTGRHWRLTMLDGRLLVAWQRIPASIVGDGQRSVRRLVRATNEAIGQRDGFPTAQPIVIDNSAKRDLARQGLALRSVLNEGQTAVVHFACNSALGGRTRDVTKDVDGGFIRVAAEAAEALGAKFAGVDIIADDITKAPKGGAFYINEVNTTPDLLSPHYDVAGRSSAVSYAEALLSATFQHARPGRSKSDSADAAAARFAS